MEYKNLLNNKKLEYNDDNYFIHKNIEFNLLAKLVKNYFIFFIYCFNIFLIYKQLNNKNNFFSLENHMNYSFRKFNDYIITSLNEILINNQKVHLLNPKISAVAINYNSEKTIKKAIRSIQNQNMLDIEIFIIDDHSSDRSLAIIEQLEKEDQRIKVIKNNRNYGALYTRSLGVLLSNGKYIMSLDSDDLFINNQIFNICFNEAENNNLDIVEFSGFQIKKPILRLNNKLPNIAFYLRYKENNLTIKQPKLFQFLYLKKKGNIVRLNDGYIWGKCIKTSIYLKAIKTLDKNIYKQNMNYSEDRIVNFVLFKLAYSFKFIENYGIIYIYNPLSIFHSYNREFIAHDELLNLFSIYNQTKYSPDLSIVVYELKYRWKNIIIPGLNNENKNNTIYLIKLLLKSNYLNYKDKQILMNFFKEINL